MHNGKAGLVFHRQIGVLDHIYLQRNVAVSENFGDGRLGLTSRGVVPGAGDLNRRDRVGRDVDYAAIGLRNGYGDLAH